MTLKQDPITGKYLPGGTLEESQKQAMREGVKRGKVIRESDLLRDNLLALGFVDPFPADILTLGEKFIENKTGSMGAYGNLLKRSPKFKDDVNAWNGEGECPLCLGKNQTALPLETIDKLLVVYDWLVEEKGGKKTLSNYAMFTPPEERQGYETINNNPCEVEK